MSYKIIQKISAKYETTFFTESSSILQVGLIAKSETAAVLKHKHTDLERVTIGTAEVLYCLKGSGIMLYSETEESGIEYVPFSIDDLIIFHGGVHEFKFNEDTLLLEVKNGPYLGQADDKVYVK